MPCFCLRDYCCCCLYLFLAIVIIVLVVIVPTFCQQFWCIREANHSCTFTLIFQWKRNSTWRKKIFFLPRLDFSSLSGPPLSFARMATSWRSQATTRWEKYSVAQILFQKNILLHKYYFIFCLSWFVVRTVAGQLALVMNFQDVRWAKEKKIIIFLPRCQVAR